MTATTISPTFVQAYTAKIAPVLPFTVYNPDGSACNLTSAVFSGFIVDQAGTVTRLTAGNFAIVSASTGTASYQFSLTDLSSPLVGRLWITVKLPAESPKIRELDPITFVVLPTAEYIGGLIVQEVDLNINGSPNAVGNPAFVQLVAAIVSHVIVDSLPAIALAASAGVNIGSVEILDGAGSNKLAIDSSGRVTIASVAGALPTGTNVIGHVINDAGTAVIGHVISDTGSTSAVTQTTASSLNATATIQAVTGTALAVGSNALPVLSSSAQGYVAAYGSNSAALTSGTDYLFKWGSSGLTQVNHVMIQNNTAAAISWDLDAVTTAGSPTLAAGQTLFLDVLTLVVHLQQAGTPNVNGSSGSNIVVRGWL